MEPQFFISRLLKASYFLFVSFREDGIGSNPNFVWRSKFICAGSIQKLGIVCLVIYGMIIGFLT